MSVSRPSRWGVVGGSTSPNPSPIALRVPARLPRPGLGAAPRASPRPCESPKQGPSGVSPSLDMDLGSMDVSAFAPTSSSLWASVQ